MLWRRWFNERVGESGVGLAWSLLPLDRTRRTWVDESRIHHASRSDAESRRTQIARPAWLSFTWTSHLLLITTVDGTSDIWMHVNNLYTDAELYLRTQAVGSDRRRQLEGQYCVFSVCVKT